MLRSLLRPRDWPANVEALQCIAESISGTTKPVSVEVTPAEMAAASSASISGLVLRLGGGATVGGAARKGAIGKKNR